MPYKQELTMNKAKSKGEILCAICNMLYVDGSVIQ
jgi:prepilin-type processing-associated H-X9-DG protein